MPEVQQDLRPATPDEIAEALSFALRYDGRRRIHNGDTLMAWITAERLVAHLERSGFVLMKRAPAGTPSAPNYTQRGLGRVSVPAGPASPPCRGGTGVRGPHRR